MKKCILLLSFLVCVSGCSMPVGIGIDKADSDLDEKESIVSTDLEANFFEDDLVYFEYPMHWETRSSDRGQFFSSQFDYFDGLSKSSAEDEKEGSLVYSVEEKNSELSLPFYLQYEFKSCVDSAESMRTCRDPEIQSWEEIRIDGRYSYITPWIGIPAAGEIGKSLFIDLGDKYVKLVAVKTGQTDEEIINKAFNETVRSFKLK